MNSNRNVLKVTGVVLVAIAGSIAAVACSSSSSPSGTTVLEGGVSEDGSSSGASSSSSSSSGASSSSSSGSSGGDASSEGGGTCIPDGGLDGALCNSCAAIGSYNSCSQYTGNCRPFNNVARGVPFTADGGLPTP